MRSAPIDHRSARTESARDALRSFYCDLCGKGYGRASDWDAHLLSYDHQHNKRFKEMKDMQRDSDEADRRIQRELRREQREIEHALMQRQQASGRSVESSLSGNTIATAAVDTTIGSTSSATANGSDETITTRSSVDDKMHTLQSGPARKPLKMSIQLKSVPSQKQPNLFSGQLASQNDMPSDQSSESTMSQSEGASRPLLHREGHSQQQLYQQGHYQENGKEHEQEPIHRGIHSRNDELYDPLWPTGPSILLRERSQIPWINDLSQQQQQV